MAELPDTSWMRPGARCAVTDASGDVWQAHIVEAPAGSYTAGFPKRWIVADDGPDRSKLDGNPVPWPVEAIHPIEESDRG